MRPGKTARYKIREFYRVPRRGIRLAAEPPSRIEIGGCDPRYPVRGQSPEAGRSKVGQPHRRAWFQARKTPSKKAMPPPSMGRKHSSAVPPKLAANAARSAPRYGRADPFRSRSGAFRSAPPARTRTPALLGQQRENNCGRCRKISCGFCGKRAKDPPCLRALYKIPRGVVKTGGGRRRGNPLQVKKFSRTPFKNFKKQENRTVTLFHSQNNPKSRIPIVRTIQRESYVYANQTNGILRAEAQNHRAHFWNVRV